MATVPLLFVFVLVACLSGSAVDASSVAAWSAVGLLGLAAASALQLGAL